MSYNTVKVSSNNLILYGPCIILQLHVVQLETQRYFMVVFIHNIYQLYGVSDLIGPSSGASFKAV
jgi:hypothetical protein